MAFLCGERFALTQTSRGCGPVPLYYFCAARARFVVEYGPDGVSLCEFALGFSPRFWPATGGICPRSRVNRPGATSVRPGASSVAMSIIDLASWFLGRLGHSAVL